MSVSTFLSILLQWMHRRCMCGSCFSENPRTICGVCLSKIQVRMSLPRKAVTRNCLDQHKAKISTPKLPFLTGRTGWHMWWVVPHFGCDACLWCSMNMVQCAVSTKMLVIVCDSIVQWQMLQEMVMADPRFVHQLGPRNARCLHTLQPVLQCSCVWHVVCRGVVM